MSVAAHSMIYRERGRTLRGITLLVWVCMVEQSNLVLGYKDDDTSDHGWFHHFNRRQKNILVSC